MTARMRPVLIAQITDTHIGFDRTDPEEFNALRLRALISHLAASPHRPDLVLLSGDLTEHGDAASYGRLAEIVAACPFPLLVMAGNHDDRAALLAAFPATRTGDGFVQGVAELPGLRLIALDTTEPGRHGGAFCDERAGWLRAQLAIEPGVPAVIAMHHPPFVSGLDWLDPAPDAAWIARFAAAIAGQPQVKAILCGHLHRPIVTALNGVPLVVCPSGAAAVSLDLRKVEPDAPDRRAMIVDEPPGYALHRWDGERLVTHFQLVEVSQGWPVLARNDAAMQSGLRKIADERKP